MYGLTRGTVTLIGAGAAGLLIWIATQTGTDTTGEYWATLGLLAGAGLTLALSQLLGGWTKWGWPQVSPTVFLLGFLPAFVVGGWIVVGGQPGGNDARGRVVDWSGDIGIGGLVGDLTGMVPVIAFALGLLFGFTFDTTGPRRREPEVVYADEQRVAEEPVSAEREEIAAHEEFHEPDREVERSLSETGETRVEIRESGTPVAPQPEPGRRRDDLV